MRTVATPAPHRGSNGKETADCMKGFVDDIGRLTKGNADFRRVLYTGHHLQLVLMTLPPGGEIGS